MLGDKDSEVHNHEVNMSTKKDRESEVKNIYKIQEGLICKSKKLGEWGRTIVNSKPAWATFVSLKQKTGKTKFIGQKGLGWYLSTVETLGTRVQHLFFNKLLLLQFCLLREKKRKPTIHE
jgi:hypothetical protein